MHMYLKWEILQQEMILLILIKGDTMNKQEMIKTFEYHMNKGKLKAYSKLSLERPLTDEEYKHMMQLKERVM